MGDYIPVKLGMDEGEKAVKMVVTTDYSGILLFGFDNGKIAKVPLSAYQTKTNRKKLSNAYSDKAELMDIAFCNQDSEFVVASSSGRILLLHSGAIALKATRNTQGVAVLKLKKGQRLMSIKPYADGSFAKPARFRNRAYIF